VVLDVELLEVMGEFAVLGFHDAEASQVEAAEGGFGVVFELGQVAD
jgi:hypothetical protein